MMTMMMMMRPSEDLDPWTRHSLFHLFLHVAHPPTPLLASVMEIQLMSSRLTRRENSLRGFLFGSILKRKGDDVRNTLFRPALPRATRRLPGDKGCRCPATTIVALLQEWKQAGIWKLCLYGAFASFLSDMKTAPVVLVKHKHSKRQTTFIKWTGILYIHIPYEFIYFNAAPWVKIWTKLRWAGWQVHANAVIETSWFFSIQRWDMNSLLFFF